MSQFNKGYFQKYAGHTSGASFAKKLRYFQLGVAKHIKFFHIAFHYIQNLPYGAKVLDIGCGRGVLLHDIHDIRPDLKLYGCDIGDVSEFYGKDIQFSQIKDDDILPFGDEVFDLVLSTQVIEHLDHPVKQYNEIYRVLKTDAIAYIATSSVKMLLLPGNLNFYVDPTHVRPFTQKGLWTLGVMSDLDMISWGYNRDYPVNGMILGILFPVFGLLNIVSQRFESLFQGGVHFLIGSGIYGVYKKNTSNK